MQIAVHISWGDIENSKFFIEEIVETSKQKRFQLVDVDNCLKILAEILKLNNDELQEARLKIMFNVDNFTSHSLFKYLQDTKDFSTPFVLKYLAFIADLC